MGIGVWGGWCVEKSKAGIVTQPGPRISLTVWHDDILGFKLYFLDTGGACTSDESNDGNNWAVIPSYLKGDSYHKHQSLGVTNRLRLHGNCGKLVLTLGTIKMFRSTGPEIAWLCNMHYKLATFSRRQKANVPTRRYCSISPAMRQRLQFYNVSINWWASANIFQCCLRPSGNIGKYWLRLTTW